MNILEYAPIYRAPGFWSTLFSSFQNACSEKPSRGQRRINVKEQTMCNKKLSAAAAAAILAVGFSGATTVLAADKPAFAREVDSCLEAVNATLDLDSAKRVRHFVSNAKRTGIGYVLTIETAVTFATSEKNYEAYCVANGNNAPLTFRIEETDG
jgi:hypothetical protein